MKYYTIQNNGLLIADSTEALTRFYNNVLPLPQDYETDKYIVVEGELVLNPDWADLQLQRAKEAKIQENDTARDEALLQGVTYKDVLFDSDTDQKVNLSAQIGFMDDEETVNWYGMDSISYVTCTKEDLLNIGGLIKALTSFVWTHNSEIKVEINDAETIEEVDAIVIDYTLPEGEDEDTTTE